MIADTMQNHAKVLKNTMKAQITKNYFCHTMADKFASVEKFEQMGNIYDVAKKITTPAPAGSWKPVTYALTYPGRLDFPSAYDGLIADYTIGSLVRAFSLMGVTYGDKMQIQILQRFDSNHLANSVLEEFKALGLDAKMSDLGIVSGNVMILEKLKVE